MRSTTALALFLLTPSLSAHDGHSHFVNPLTHHVGEAIAIAAVVVVLLLVAQKLATRLPTDENDSE